MTHKTRRIIFYLFLTAFIVLVPLIILYALGYNFDFEQKTLIASGGIYLKSYPPKADIYINDKPKGKTNRVVSYLVPKIYKIKVAKEEYYPWQKELIIESGLITRANNIFLVPFNPIISLMATESEAHSIFKEEKKQNYLLSKNNLYNLNNSPPSLLVSNVMNYVVARNKIIYLEYFTGQIYELNLDNLESKPIFEQVFPSFNEGKWILSSDKKKLLCQKNYSMEILWLEDVVNNSIIRKKGEIEKIELGAKINQVIWHPLTDEHLIVATNDSILITELDNRPPRNTINFITTPFPQLKYDLKSKTLYFLSQERLYRTEL